MKLLTVILILFLVPACSDMTCSQNRHRAIRYMNEGIKKFSDGLHEPALHDLQAAVREDDSFSLAHYNIAKVYQEMKRWDEAQRHLNRVVGLEPQNPRFHYELGICYQMLDRLDLAQKEYDTALNLNPLLYAAHFRRGTIYMGMDKPREADAAFRKTIEINPRFTRAFVKLGVLYLNYDYPDVATQVLQAGVQINESSEDSAEAYNILGVAYQMLKQYDKAIASFKKALELKTDLYDTIYNLGMTYADADRRKEAEEALTRFTKVAAGKRGVDADFIRAAHDKIAELVGNGDSDE